MRIYIRANAGESLRLSFTLQSHVQMLTDVRTCVQHLGKECVLHLVKPPLQRKCRRQERAAQAWRRPRGEDRPPWGGLSQVCGGVVSWQQHLHLQVQLVVVSASGDPGAVPEKSKRVLLLHHPSHVPRQHVRVILRVELFGKCFI